MVPDSWHLQRVALFYKKGDAADCSNYRPICLLNAAYKIFAMFLLRRLQRAGVDDHVWPSQFGFRRNRGTEDALHCVRRAVERAWADRGAVLHLLALDWRRAFDSISTDALLNALRRFGLPGYFCDVIRSIYTGRVFEVSECGETSSRHRQDAGVCQGCPLSPFLFVIVMTLLMHDTIQLLSTAGQQAFRDGTLFDVLYADDTILLGSDAALLQEFAAAIERTGINYGMSLHWGKTQALSVCTDTRIRSPDGEELEGRSSVSYLGALVTSDGRADSEISRKLGAARADVIKLQRVWSHAGVGAARKVELLVALVISRLVYGLSLFGW